MANDSIRVEIAGEEVVDLYRSILSTEVEMDENMASMLRMTLNLSRSESGWQPLDLDILVPWKEIAVSAQIGDDDAQLFSGYITQVKTDFGSRDSEALMEIWAMDQRVAMDRQVVLKAWQDKSDSEIIEEVFSKYGLETEVEETSFVHDSDLSSVMQRETDLSLVTRLAVRNGFEWFVQGNVGYFRTPNTSDSPQGILSVLFGVNANTTNFRLQLDGLSFSRVNMHQVDRLSKEIRSIEVGESSQEALGDTASDKIIGERTIPVDGSPIGLATLVLAQNNTYGEQEMENFSQGLVNQSSWLVTASAVVDSGRYRKIIWPRKRITVKGVGEQHSGDYYVSHVTHVFNGEGYRQMVRLKRNGVGLLGSEQFE